VSLILILLEKKVLTGINGGFSAGPGLHGLYKVNGYLIDVMNKQYIQQREVSRIDRQTGLAEYRYVDVKNPQWRGDEYTTSFQLFIGSLIIGGVIGGLVSSSI
jgi:hypothetical protein